MRTIANLNQAIKLNGNLNAKGLSECIEFQNNIRDIKSFLIDKDNFTLDVKNNDKEVYLPFKLCSFDFVNPIEVPLDAYKSFYNLVTKGRAPLLNSSNMFSRPVLFGSLSMEMPDLSIYEWIVFGDYYNLKTGEINNFTKLNSFFGSPSLIGMHSANYEMFNSISLTAAWLRKISEKKCFFGTSKRNLFIKKSGRCPELVKKLVVVSKEKTIKDETVANEVGEVDWKHTWDVMGHWRRINPNMVGKDRDGNYSIIGSTWVKPHQKGNGIYIKKDRIVKNNITRGEVYERV